MTLPTLIDRTLDAMRFRCIGPPRGGRVVAVAGDPVNAAVFYFGAAAGGVWKTEDAGTTWTCITDGFLRTSSVGALAVSDSDPHVIFAGMGESTIRADVSPGDGVYRSTDGGRSWRHVGLADSAHIGEIKIHPKDPDRVYVAALGHAFGPNAERGVFRSRNGGESWDRVLYVSEHAGAVDLSIDPLNPDVIYATSWHAHRNFFELSSGGPGSGLWRSTDGGDTWEDISRQPGLPAEGMLGKIGVSASPARAGRVWALVESSVRPGLYRSDDFGATWSLTSSKQDLRYRPWYYMHVFADPVDPHTVYVNNLSMWVSHDGGGSFTEIPTPHGDNHDLWIDPCDNRRMVQGNDGGATVSFNAGGSWSTIYNQLTAQFYTVATDTREPFYHVYGTQQDNSSISVPSGTADGAIVWGDCYPAGTGESGYMAVDPRDPDIVYVGAVGSSPGGGGALQRYDHRTGQIRLINVWPEDHRGIGPSELRYRFPWTFPILFSPHDPGTLYTTGNVVFRSRSEGQTWEAVSPDLTRNDTSRLAPSGGPITKDTSGAEHYCTIYTLRESSQEPGVLWAGSDDGLVHLSRDGGGAWQDVTPPDLPEWSFVRTVEPSPSEAGVAYVAATRYKLDDPSPYLFKTEDYGASWRDIAGSGDGAIPAGELVRVIRVDPARPGVLYVGTETGLFVSLDDGGTWRRWQSNLPVTPIYDLEVKGSDLVIATHGRSFWILDDLTPLHQIAAAPHEGAARLFRPRRTWRVLPDLLSGWFGQDGKDYMIGLGKAATYVARKNDAGFLERTFLDAGEGVPLGAIIYFDLESALTPDADASLAFLDENGNLVRAFRPKPAGYDEQPEEDQALDPGPWLPIAAGLNRFVWDLRFSGARRLRGNKTGDEGNRGPLVLPGIYQARLRVGRREETASFEVVNDPRSGAALADLAGQQALHLRICAKLSALYDGVERLRAIRLQLQGWIERLAGRAEHERILVASRTLDEKLADIESALILPGEQTDIFGLNLRSRLNAALATVVSVVESADAKPTAQATELAEEYMSRIDVELERLASAVEGDLATLNDAIREARLPGVMA